jgi:hypothetical protein
MSLTTFVRNSLYPKGNNVSKDEGLWYLTFYVALFLIHSIWEQVPNTSVLPQISIYDFRFSSLMAIEHVRDSLSLPITLQRRASPPQHTVPLRHRRTAMQLPCSHAPLAAQLAIATRLHPTGVHFPVPNSLLATPRCHDTHEASSLLAFPFLRACCPRHPRCLPAPSFVVTVPITCRRSLQACSTEAAARSRALSSTSPRAHSHTASMRWTIVVRRRRQEIRPCGQLALFRVRRSVSLIGVVAPCSRATRRRLLTMVPCYSWISHTGALFAKPWRRHSSSSLRSSSPNDPAIARSLLHPRSARRLS